MKKRSMCQSTIKMSHNMALVARNKLKAYSTRQFDGREGDFPRLILQLRTLGYLWGKTEWFKVILVPHPDIKPPNNNEIDEEFYEDYLRNGLKPYHIQINYQVGCYVLSLSQRFVDNIGDPIYDVYNLLLYEKRPTTDHAYDLNQWQWLKIELFEIHGVDGNIDSNLHAMRIVRKETEIHKRLRQFNCLCLHHAAIEYSNSTCINNISSKHSIKLIKFMYKDNNRQHRRHRLSIICLIHGDIFKRAIPELYEILYSFLI